MMAQSTPRELGPETAAAGLQSAISAAVVAACVHAFGDHLRGIVLTGSLARGEATFVRDSAGWNALGDAEFFLVFREFSRLPSRESIDNLRREIEARLSQSGIAVHVGLSPVRRGYFKSLRRQIFTYELKAWGKVLWGDDQILDLVPTFEPEDISLDDAWRLLNNRMIELLEKSTPLAGTPSVLPETVAYRTVKLYLDTATSFLVFRRQYVPTYRHRAEKLAGMSDSGPFLSFEAFSTGIVQCTKLKLNGADCAHFGLEFWRDAVEYARQLWRWELNRLIGTECGLPGAELVAEWARRQPRHLRLRGWAAVLRRCDWRTSWRYSHHWPRRALASAPRYNIYAAASDLLFRLPGLIDAGREWEDELGGLYLLLPVTHRPNVPDWRSLAGEIAWNYHEFLEFTSS